MKIINEDGVSQGTKIMSLGKDISADICVTDIILNLSVDEPVEAQIRCLIPKFSVEVIPENVTFIQDTVLLDGMMQGIETLFIHDMSKEVSQGLINIKGLLEQQLKLLK